MGAAKDSVTCGKIIFDQVASVGRLALLAPSFGSSVGPTAAGGTANAGKLAQLRQLYTELQTTYSAAKTNGPYLPHFGLGKRHSGKSPPPLCGRHVHQHR